MTNIKIEVTIETDEQEDKTIGIDDFEHNPRLKIPENEVITVYKVFGGAYNSDIPKDICGFTDFKFGVNIWDETKTKRQSGFYVYANRKDAYREHSIDENVNLDLLVPVTINTRDIVKATNKWEGFWVGPARVYQVRKFRLLKKDWNREKKERW